MRSPSSRRPVRNQSRIKPTASGLPARRGDHGALRQDGWHLEGTKPFCSGSTSSIGMVTAECADGYRLFDISVRGERHRGPADPGRRSEWLIPSVRHSSSEGRRCRERRSGSAQLLSRTTRLLVRGNRGRRLLVRGARGLVEHTLPRGRARIHRNSSLPNWDMPWPISISCDGSWQAADEIDGDPHDQKAWPDAGPWSSALRPSCIAAIVDPRRRSWGSRALCHDTGQARRAADLYVYLAQYHGPQDASAWATWRVMDGRGASRRRTEPGNGRANVAGANWLEASRLTGATTATGGRAPHPDDEVLGAGGLLQHMASVGVEAILVAVTDGEAFHPRDPAFGQDLPRRRRSRARGAHIVWGRLDSSGATRFADGSVADRILT